VHETLLASCKACHASGGAAGATRLVLGGGTRADWAAARALVDRARPGASLLLTKAAGMQHGGGAVLALGSPGQRMIARWIATGAQLEAAAAAGTTSVPAPPAPRRRTTMAAPVPAPASAPAAPTSEAPAPPNEAPASAPPAVPVARDLGGEAHAILVGACGACHVAGGAAAGTRLVLDRDRDHDLAAARVLVDASAPAASPLVTKANGREHGGGAVLPPEDPRSRTLVAWIEAGTPVAPPSPPRPASPDTTPAAVALAPAPLQAPAIPHPAPYHPGAIPLPGELRLNGRFDLDYERRNFENDPFAAGATSALRSYHHFVFLSRESAADPFGFTAEIVELTFWEAHARFGHAWWRGAVSVGKLLVPFGAEPLFHQSYGGLVGFDQRVLPPVWAQEGAALHLSAEPRGLALTLDLYGVRGYRLAHADDLINLQADFSTSDDVRFGFGQRAGVAYGPAVGLYSTYVNPLGFGRTLVMQAVDVGVARLRGIPVANHFTVAAGFLRADVSGGGAGHDYYLFASYLQLRCHPAEWLYVQYRQGLRTFDNRRGFAGDDRRWTQADGSTHNFGVVARVAGASVGLFYFFLLEKTNEVADDLLRLMVAYDF
jgi:hypothetical protein